MLVESIATNTTGNCDESLASEKAMLKFIHRMGCDFEAMRDRYVAKKDLMRFVFDPVRKRMSTIIDAQDKEEIANTQYGYPKRLHVKGASEIVLETCEFYLDENGERRDLDDKVKS
jgi:Ca2+-transporting ATPase